jgi:carbonic anhydrase
MQQLIAGVHKFQQRELGRYRELFHRLSTDGQNPHTLFITCSDSRVLAELITQSKPGDLFVVKNVGNLVPPATVTGSTNSTAAAIEFAVGTLGVNDVVVCGHSQCGAMAALLSGVAAKEAQPHLNAWLELAAPVRELITRILSTGIISRRRSFISRIGACAIYDLARLKINSSPVCTYMSSRVSDEPKTRMPWSRTRRRGSAT